MNVHVDCWLNVKHERKCAAALDRLVADTRWPAVSWEAPYHDRERGLFQVEGTFVLDHRRRADAVSALLESLTGVTNHCVVSGPRVEADGSWEFYASADGRQVDFQQIRSLTVIASGPAPSPHGS